MCKIKMETKEMLMLNVNYFIKSEIFKSKYQFFKIQLTIYKEKIPTIIKK